MTKPQEHAPTPPAVKHPVYRHSSETARSPNDAGGEVSRRDYADNRNDKQP